MSETCGFCGAQISAASHREYIGALAHHLRRECGSIREPAPVPECSTREEQK